MDAGALGGVIGVGVMAFFCISLKLYDVLQKRNMKNSVSTPLLAHKPQPLIIKTRQHWKVKDLFKNSKKTILLKNLNSMSASRELTTISIKQ